MSGQFHLPQAVLRAVLESPRDIVIFALDRDYRYLAFNQNHARIMKRIWDVDLKVGACMLDMISLPDQRLRARENFDRALLGESFTRVEEYGDEHRFRRVYEDVYSPIRDEDGSVIGLTVYLSDITQRRHAEIELENYRSRLEDLVQKRSEELELAHAQLLHAQKLESLGLLAGGIAHDFNNLLAVVLGRAELTMSQLESDHPARAHLSIVQQTALEARMLTKQLLSYAGRGKFMVQVASLNELVDSMMQLLRASVSRAITLEFELSPEAAAIEVDVTQMRQVLLNLVTNAAEAIGDGPGQVTVRTRIAEADERMLRRASVQSGLVPGRYACLEVEDTGVGMDERVRSKLFDPFFTTKFSGRGLGLAAVLGIITSHHGTILVQSRLGHGSTFTVLLPLSEGVPDALPLARAPDRAPPAPEHPGTILVVDDEEPVRTVTAEVLKAFDYHVFTADGGHEAVNVYRTHMNEIDIVLLDLTMPEMNGEETLRALQAVNADVKVVLMTGYTEDEVRLRFVRGDLAGFLTKPFVRDELITAVEAAVKRRRLHSIAV
jgi:signal transduction histidine kinase/ActR/RegA family two-component response regulator